MIGEKLFHHRFETGIFLTGKNFLELGLELFASDRKECKMGFGTTDIASEYQVTIGHGFRSQRHLLVLWPPPAPPVPLYKFVGFLRSPTSRLIIGKVFRRGAAPSLDDWVHQRPRQ